MTTTDAPQVTATEPNAQGYQEFSLGGFTLPPRRVLRPHHLADRQPRPERRRLPAGAAARRGLGLLLRHRQLRRRVRHREPLRHGRHVRRPLQRRLPQGRARPRRELRDAAHPRDLQGDARRLDERGLRSLRQPGRDGQALRRQERRATPTPSPAAGSPPSAWSACPGDEQIRTDATHPINRMFADVPQDEPEVARRARLRGRGRGLQPVRLPQPLRRHVEPVRGQRVQGQPLLPDHRGVHPARSSTATTGSSGSSSSPTRSAGRSRTATPASPGPRS